MSLRKRRQDQNLCLKIDSCRVPGWKESHGLGARLGGPAAIRYRWPFDSVHSTRLPAVISATTSGTPLASVRCERDIGVVSTRRPCHARTMLLRYRACVLHSARHARGNRKKRCGAISGRNSNFVGRAIFGRDLPYTVRQSSSVLFWSSRVPRPGFCGCLRCSMSSILGAS